jgi:hypothetical protein
MAAVNRTSANRQQINGSTMQELSSSMFDTRFKGIGYRLSINKSSWESQDVK